MGNRWLFSSILLTGMGVLYASGQSTATPKPPPKTQTIIKKTVTNSTVTTTSTTETTTTPKVTTPTPKPPTKADLDAAYSAAKGQYASFSGGTIGKDPVAAAKALTGSDTRYALLSSPAADSFGVIVKSLSNQGAMLSATQFLEAPTPTGDASAKPFGVLWIQSELVLSNATYINSISNLDKVTKAFKLILEPAKPAVKPNPVPKAGAKKPKPTSPSTGTTPTPDPKATPAPQKPTPEVSAEYDSAVALLAKMQKAEKLYTDPAGLGVHVKAVLTNAKKQCDDSLAGIKKASFGPIPAYSAPPKPGDTAGIKAFEDSGQTAMTSLVENTAAYSNAISTVYQPNETLAVALGYKIASTNDPFKGAGADFLTSFDKLSTSLDADVPGITSPDKSHLVAGLNLVYVTEQQLAKDIASLQTATGGSAVDTNFAVAAGSNLALQVDSMTSPLSTLSATLAHTTRFAKAPSMLDSLIANMSISGTVLRVSIQPVNSASALDMSKYVTDQVRLFYFNNVPRLMRSLSNDVTMISPVKTTTAPDEATSLSAFVSAKKDVLTNFTTVSEDRNQRNILAAQLPGLASVVAQKKVALNLAQRNYDAATVTQKANQAVYDAANLQYTNAQTDQTNARAQLATDTVALETAKANPPSQQSGTDPTIVSANATATANYQAHLAGMQSVLVDDQAAITQAGQRMTALAPSLAAAFNQKNQSDNHASELNLILQAAQKDETAAETALSKAQTDLDTAVTKIATDNAALLNARVQSLLTSGTELQAFAEARDNAPFLVSFAAAGTSDVSRHVMIYGYPDSNTLCIRGRPEDVQSVKQIIADFDRPVPQARITLYTLQINGSNPTTMSERINHISGELRSYRDVSSLLQDLLRNSVVKEVNRCSSVAADSLKRQGIVAPERLTRYFYYPTEVRKRLGMDIELDPQIAKLESIRQELLGAVETMYKVNNFRPRNPKSKNAVFASLLGSVYDHLSDAQFEVKDYQDWVKAQNVDPKREVLSHLERIATDLNKELKLLAMFMPYKDPISIQLPILEGSKKTDELSQCLIKVCKELKKVDDGSYKEILKEIGEDQEITPEQYALLAFQFVKQHTQGNDIDVTPIEMPALKLAELDSDLVLKDQQLVGSSDAPTQSQLQSAQYLTQFTLPDPVHGTTLGELIFVISLGDKQSRQAILRDFMRSVQQRFPDESLDKKNATSDEKSRQADGRYPTVSQRLQKFIEDLSGVLDPYGVGKKGSKLYPAFPGTLLGAERTVMPSENASNEIGANQLEVLLAMEAKARSNCASEIRYLCREISKEETDGRTVNDAPAQFLRAQYVPLVGWLSQRMVVDQANTPLGHEFVTDGKTYWNLIKRTDDVTVAGLKFLGSTAGPSSAQGSQFDLQPILSGSLPTSISQVTRMDQRAWGLSQLVGARNDLIHATPRVAAADDMIKRMIVIIENDFDYYFTSPALEYVLHEASTPPIQFGSFQKESVLASNRLVARVDPTATGNIATGGGEDYAAEAVQLGQLLGDTAPQPTKLPTPNNGAYGSSAQDLGAAAGTAAIGVGTGMLKKSSFSSPFKGTNSLAVGGLLGLFDFIGKQAAPHPTQLYSLQTGNTFQITPIFDPSGQALRFKFDYDAGVLVQEPNGAASTIPRVDHHRVDTEVQLTNLEMREISSFESNSRIGTPRIKSGGIPFLRDLPILKEVPLIGYFYQEPKTEPLRQESLIFAQTSIYPTVSDIVDLLTESSVRSDLYHETPAYLSGSPRQTTIVTGKVSSYFSDTLNVTISSHTGVISQATGPARVHFSPTTQIVDSDQKELAQEKVESALKEGATATVEGVLVNGVIEAEKIQVKIATTTPALAPSKLAMLSGSVLSIDPKKALRIAVSGHTGFPLAIDQIQVNLASAPTLLDPYGDPIDIAAFHDRLKANPHVRVEGTYDESVINATKVQIINVEEKMTISGQINLQDASRFFVTVPGTEGVGGDVPVKIGPSTIFYNSAGIKMKPPQIAKAMKGKVNANVTGVLGDGVMIAQHVQFR